MEISLVCFQFQGLAGISLLLVEKYDILKMEVVVVKGNCPTNKGICPIGVIVLRGRCR